MQTSAPAEVVAQLPTLAARRPDSHKGDFGRILIVAGSRDMSGAAILSASAALRSGAGLVYLAVPEGIQDRVAGANPCYLTIGLPQDERGQIAGQAAADLVRLAGQNDVLAIGPGLGQSDALQALVHQVLEQTTIPIVLDADGLNVLRGQTEVLARHKGGLILTPHPGEFGRLVNQSIASVQAARHELAASFAAERQVVVLLKGNGTVVTDGRRLYQNTTGNPGMATGGSGDVLTGLIAALLGQKLEPFAAAQLGSYIHGFAGDLARDRLGEVSLIASDLLEYLPHVFRNL